MNGYYVKDAGGEIIGYLCDRCIGIARTDLVHDGYDIEPIEPSDYVMGSRYMCASCCVEVSGQFDGQREITMNCEHVSHKPEKEGAGAHRCNDCGALLFERIIIGSATIGDNPLLVNAYHVRGQKPDGSPPYVCFTRNEAICLAATVDYWNRTNERKKFSLKKAKALIQKTEFVPWP